MKNIYDPCVLCDKYPHNCSNMCEPKMEYVNEVDEDVPIVRNSKHKKQSCGYEINKNGIRREIPRRNTYGAKRNYC